MRQEAAAFRCNSQWMAPLLPLAVVARAGTRHPRNTMLLNALLMMMGLLMMGGRLHLAGK